MFINYERIGEVVKSLLLEGRIIPFGKCRWEPAIGEFSLFVRRFWQDGYAIEARVSVVPLAELGIGMITEEDSGGCTFLEDGNGCTWFCPNPETDPARAVDLARNYRKTWARYRLAITASRGGKVLSTLHVDGVEGDTYPEPDERFDAAVKDLVPEVIEDANIKMAAIYDSRRLH